MSIRGRAEHSHGSRKVPCSAVDRVATPIPQAGLSFPRLAFLIPSRGFSLPEKSLRLGPVPEALEVEKWRYKKGFS